MKKVMYVLASVFIFLAVSKSNAQTDQECIIKYNYFNGDYKSKKFDSAYTHWIWLMDNCPTLSVNIYKLGGNIAEMRYKNAANKTEAMALVRRVYEQRLKNYPDQDPAKVHSDFATFLIDNKEGSENEIFSILEKAYKIDPTRLGVKNIYRYFQGVTDRNKDTNPQVVFDTYDDVIESVNEKLDDYSKKIAPLNKKVDAEQELSAREKRLLRAYSINSKALGMVEAGLDNIIVELSTCDRLIPLYTRDFEANKTNAKWLSRAVSRLFNKECTDDPLYEKLVGAWVAADPSPKTTVYYAGILYKKGKVNEAMDYYKKAVDQEPNPIEKAKNLLKIAQLFSAKGQKAQARNYANQALRNNPNLGNAYLLIAGMYASSANDCGNNLFEKRMVYVAALNKARRAAAVDPSISVKAGKYISNYKSNSPSKKEIFTQGVQPGTSFTIKCWIGETVKIPEGN